MQKLVIKIRKGKHHTAKSKMTGLYHAQQHIAEAIAKGISTAHDTLMLLHALEIRELFRDMASKPQQQYTIKLTVVQAEAYRQMWGGLDLKYEAYGAVQVQDLLNEINRELDRPLQLPNNGIGKQTGYEARYNNDAKRLDIYRDGKPVPSGNVNDIEDFNPNHFGTL